MVAEIFTNEARTANHDTVYSGVYCLILATEVPNDLIDDKVVKASLTTGSFVEGPVILGN